MSVDYNLTGLMDVAVFLNSGTGDLFWSVLLVPVWFILMISFRNSGNGGGVDSMNISSFICMVLCFVLNSVGLVSIIPTGIFLSLTIIGLLLSKFLP